MFHDWTLNSLGHNQIRYRFYLGGLYFTITCNVSHCHVVMCHARLHTSPCCCQLQHMGAVIRPWPNLLPWCHRTESIVSFERGVCSCAELQVFSCYRHWREACETMHVISTSRHKLSSSFFPARQGAKGNSRNSERNIRGTSTIVCHRQKLGCPV